MLLCTYILRTEGTYSQYKYPRSRIRDIWTNFSTRKLDHYYENILIPGYFSDSNCPYQLVSPQSQGKGSFLVQHLSRGHSPARDLPYLWILDKRSKSNCNFGAQVLLLMKVGSYDLFRLSAKEEVVPTECACIHLFLARTAVGQLSRRMACKALTDMFRLVSFAWLAPP